MDGNDACPPLGYQEQCFFCSKQRDSAYTCSSLLESYLTWIFSEACPSVCCSARTVTMLLERLGWPLSYSLHDGGVIQDSAFLQNGCAYGQDGGGLLEQSPGSGLPSALCSPAARASLEQESLGHCVCLKSMSAFWLVSQDGISWAVACEIISEGKLQLRGTFNFVLGW